MTTKFRPSKVVSEDGREIRIELPTHWRISARGYEVLCSDGTWEACHPFMLTRTLRELQAWYGRLNR